MIELEIKFIEVKKDTPFVTESVPHQVISEMSILSLSLNYYLHFHTIQLL